MIEAETRELSLRLTYRTYGESAGRIDATFGGASPEEISPDLLVRIADAVGPGWGREARRWLAEEAVRTENDAVVAEERALDRARESMESTLCARRRAEVARVTAERYAEASSEGARRDFYDG